MTLQELRYIVALADTGHFGKAAEACYVTQSTLSTQLRKLEDGLGLILFDRSLKRVAPTPAGREVLARARNILAEVEHIQGLAEHGQDPMACTLRIGIIPTLAPYYLPGALTLVRRRHPALRPLLREETTRQIIDHLLAGDLDAGLLALPVADDGIQAEPLFHEHFFAALPAGHALAARKALNAGDLKSERLLLLDEGHCLRDQALDFCSTHSSVLREEVRATSLETLRQMVGMGLGITLLPMLSINARPSVLNKTVVCRPFVKPSPKRTIALIWRKHTPFPETFEQLAATLKSALPDKVEPA